MGTRSRCALSVRSLLLVAGLTMALGEAALAQTTVTWTGGGAGGYWSDPRNWSPQVVPVNTGTDRYVVVIPASRSVLVDSAVPATFAVDSISLAATSTMTLASGRVLTVASQQGLSGVVQVQGGSALNIVPAAGAPSGTLAPSYLEATGASSQFRSTASGYTLSMGQTGRTVLRAAGIGTVLDLSGATQIQFATPTQSGLIAQGIEADRGVVDLSGITSINAQGNVAADLRATTNGVIRMPSLTTLDGAVLNLTSGGQIQVGALTSFNNSSVYLNGGASFTLPSGVTSVTQNRTLGLSARGGVIDMSSLTAIRLDPNAGTTLGAGQYYLNAESGGRLDLSRLTTLERRAGQQVTVRSATGATVDLSSLRALPNAFVDAVGGTILMPLVNDLSGSRIWSSQGGRVSLPGVTSLATAASGVNGSDQRVLLVSDASVLELPNLATMLITGSYSNEGPGLLANGGNLTLPTLRTITAPFGGILNLNAASGGRLSLPALTSVPSTASILVEGAGSTLELGSLSTLSLSALRPGQFLGGADVVVRSGGTINAPQLRSLSNLDIAIDGGQFNTGEITTFESNSLNVRFGTFVFPSTFTQVGIRNTLLASQQGVIRLPSVRTLTAVPGRNSGDLVVAAESGGLVDLPLMETLSTPANANTRFSAFGAASRISMPAVRTLERVTAFYVSGLGARIDVPLLESITPSFSALDLTAENQGVLDLRSLTTVPASTRWNVTAHDGGVVRLDGIPMLGNAANSLVVQRGGRIDLPLVTTLTDTTVRLSDPTSSINFGVLQSIERSTFEVSDGARLVLPSNLTRFTVPLSSFGTGTQFLRTNSGGEIDASSVQTLAYGASASDSWGYGIVAVSGSINLRSLNGFEVTGSPTLGVQASGAGFVDVTGVRSLPARINVEAQPGAGSDPGGVVDMSGLAVLNAGVERTFTSRGAQSQVRLDALTSVSDGAGDISFSVQNAGELRVPLLQSLGNAASVGFSASGSALQLPSLTDLGGGTYRGFGASVGGTTSAPLIGTLAAPALTTFGATATVGVSSTDAGSVVSLPALTSLGSGIERRFTISRGGRISAPQLGAFNDVTLSMDGAGSTLSLGAVSNIDGTTIRASDSVTYAIPAGVTSYATGSRGTASILLAISGAVIDASSLRSIQHGNATTLGLVHTINASNGTIRLPNVTTTTSVGGGRLALEVSNGLIDLSSLTAINNADVTVSSGGLLQTGVLTSIDGSTITNWSTTPFVLPAGVRSYSADGLTAATGTAISLFNAIGSGSVLDFSSLESISYGRRDRAAQSYTVQTSGGLIDLSGLTTLAPTNGAILNLSALGTGTVRVPQITDLNGITLTMQSAGQVATGALTSISGGLLSVRDGAQFTLPSTITDYSPRARLGAGLFAQGTGSRLNLAPLQTLSFGSTEADGQTTSISATSGGTIDLSGVTTLNRLRDGFLSLTSTGTLLLPQITRLNFASIERTFGTLTLGTLTNIDDTTLNIRGGTFAVPAGVQSYSNTSRGSSVVFDAAGSARIEMPGMVSLRLGSDSVAGSVQQIRSSNSATIALGAVRDIELVNGARLSLTTSGGGVIDLGSLTTLLNTNVTVSQNNSRVLLPNVTSVVGSRLTASTTGFVGLPAMTTLDATDLAGGVFGLAMGSNSRLDMPSLRTVVVGDRVTPRVVHTLRAEGGGILAFGHDPSVQSVNDGSLLISISSATATMPRATVNSRTTFMITGLSTSSTPGLVLSGSLVNESFQPVDFNASAGAVIFAPGTVAWLEAAGSNEGLAGTRLTNSGNFGLGQLRIGSATGASAAITVVNNFDNRQVGPGEREVLYLYGAASGNERNGLFLFGGSRLIISDNTEVFSSINGVMTNLRTLVPAGQTQVAYGGGFIVIPSPGAAGVLVLAGLGALRRRR